MTLQLILNHLYNYVVTLCCIHDVASYSQACDCVILAGSVITVMCKQALIQGVDGMTDHPSATDRA